MRRNIGVISVTILIVSLFAASSHAAWARRQVGTTPNVLNQLVVGNGRNDGVERIYAVCEDGHVYEWTYTGSGFSRVDMGAAGGTGWCLGIALGRGRNDGVNRIYMTRINGHVYEYTWSGTNWTIADLGRPNTSVYGVLVGPGRNDNVPRVYACGDGVPTVEYTWTGSAWLKDTVEAAQQQWLPDIGPGRNDGVNRLYCPNGMGSTLTVAEYTWTGSDFARLNLPAVAGNPLSVFVAPGRNDGFNRVYASSRAKVYEFTYSGGSWQTVDILPSYGSEARYDIFVGRARRDGRLRAYVTCSGTQLLETSWDGAGWRDSVIDAVSSATCGVVVGRGRNDDTARVYGCNRLGEVYEFTNSSPSVAVAEEEDFARLPALFAHPNPFRSATRIEYDVPARGAVEVAVFDAPGRKVKTLYAGTQAAGRHGVVWRGDDRHGKRVPGGVYFVRANHPQVSDRATLLILR